MNMWDVTATEQALSEACMALTLCRPVADAAHAWGSAFDQFGPADVVTVRALSAVLDAHHATTPAEGRASHVVVAAARLEWLERVSRVAEVVAYGLTQPEQVAALRQVLTDRPEGVS